MIQVRNCCKTISSRLFALSIIHFYRLPSYCLIIVSTYNQLEACISGYRMQRRVGDIEEFEFCELRSDIVEVGNSDVSSKMIDCPEDLHVTIVVSGYIKNEK